MRDRESREPTTVLDHLRPTVVRRRVVVDVAALHPPKLESPDTSEPEPMPEHSSGCYPRASVAFEDDGAPPSSVFVPEGYASGASERDAEDQTLEERDDQEDVRVPSTRAPIDARPDGGDEDEEEEDEDEEPWEDVDEPAIEAPPSAHAAPSVEAAPVVDTRPTIPVGPTIAVGTIAKRLGMPSAQVAAELVSRGFFEVTPATVLTRETARIVADAFGCAVEEVPEPEPVKARRKRTARRAAPAKRTSKASKPKKRTGRSTRRAA